MSYGDRYDQGCEAGNLDGNLINDSMVYIGSANYLKHSAAYQNGFVAATDSMFHLKLPYYEYYKHKLMCTLGLPSDIVCKKR